MYKDKRDKTRLHRRESTACISGSTDKHFALFLCLLWHRHSTHIMFGMHNTAVKLDITLPQAAKTCPLSRLPS